ncbi:MAG: response regulator [Rhodospirillales bacterium]
MMRILLADDHTLVRENLRDFLHGLAPDVVVLEAETFPEAETIASRHARLDLVILDLLMPGMDGLAGLRHMLKLKPNVPVVILSGSTRQSDVVGAIELGAKGFVPKTISSKALLNALRMILAGETYVPSAVLRAAAAENGDDSLAGGPGGGAKEDPAQKLTRRQQQVLDLLVRGHTNKRIAKELDLKEITVKIHLQSVFRKFGVSNRTQAVALAFQRGMASAGDAAKGIPN